MAAHPCIARAFFYACRPTVGLALELLGPSLAQTAEETHWGGFLKSLTCITEAVEFLHGFHIVHRDLKPHHMMHLESEKRGCIKSWRMKLVDFDAAEPLDSDTNFPPTPAYAPWEQRKLYSLLGLEYFAFAASFQEVALSSLCPAGFVKETCQVLEELKGIENRTTLTQALTRIRRIDVEEALASGSDVWGAVWDSASWGLHFADVTLNLLSPVLRATRKRAQPKQGVQIAFAKDVATEQLRSDRAPDKRKEVLGPSTGVGVDPIYFDYAAATRTLRAKVQAEKAAAGQDPSAQGSADQTALKEMVAFLASQGLSGPIRAYAKALALQGVASPSELIQTESTKLSRILTLAELESTDELLLLDALRQLQ
eukprot:s759_g7.t1